MIGVSVSFILGVVLRKELLYWYAQYNAFLSFYVSVGRDDVLGFWRYGSGSAVPIKRATDATGKEVNGTRSKLRELCRFV